MVGWDEIIESGLQRESRAVMMVWRSPHAIVGAGESEAKPGHLDLPGLLPRQWAFSEAHL